MKFWTSRVRRVLIAVAAVMLALHASLSWLLPRWLMGDGLALATKALGREIRLEAVEVQPWRLGLHARGLAIAGAAGAADPQGPQLQVEGLALSLSWRSLWHRAVIVDSLQLSGARLRLAHLGDGRFDLEDIQRRLAQRPSSGGAEVRWALYNLRVEEAELRFDDRPRAQQHRIDQLHIELPFVSALDADIHTPIRPVLKGRVDGSPLESLLSLEPFSEQKPGELSLRLSGVELSRWAAYLPSDQALRPKRGLLDVAARVAFSKPAGKAAELRVDGLVELRDVQLVSPAQADEPVLSWQRLSIPINGTRPLAKQLQLGKIEWQGLQARLQRRADGSLVGFAHAAVKPVGEGPASPAKAEATGPAWMLALDGLELSDAAVRWRSAAPGPLAAMDAQQLQLKLDRLQWPMRGDAKAELKAKLSQPGHKDVTGLLATLNLAPEQARAELELQALPLRWAEAYLPLRAAKGEALALQGQASTKLSLLLADPLKAQPLDRLSIDLRETRVEGLRLASAQSMDALNLRSLALDQGHLDLNGQRLELGRLSLDGLQLPLATRGDADGAGFELAGLHPAEAASSETAQPRSEGRAGWQVRLGSFALSDAGLSWRDQAQLGEPALRFDQLRVQAQDLQWGAGGGRVQLKLTARLPDAEAGAGELRWQGQIGRDLAQGLHADGRLGLSKWPLRPWDGLLRKFGWPARLQLAQGSLSAEVALSGQAGTWDARGDLQLQDLRVVRRQADAATAARAVLLRWQSLRLDELALKLRSAEVPDLGLGQVQLRDFFAQLSIDAQGNFNLRDLNAAQSSAQPASTPAASATPKHASPTPGATTPLRVRVGGIRVDQGEVAFQDQFIKPNYSARLTQLSGSLGGFDSQGGKPAPLQLSGKLAGDGVLELAGSLNPLARPLQLSLRAEARDIALQPLSPYAERYAGYAIAGGTLSSRLSYEIDAAGRLQAQNQLILDQLLLGDRVESPDATRLPIALALNLLKDSRGVIDVNLPISGSLDDPEFNVGGLVLRLFGQMIGKALTSPFSLLGGGQAAPNLHEPVYEMGRAELKDSSQLDALARALGERPRLVLHIRGLAAPSLEDRAWREAQLEGRLGSLAVAAPVRARNLEALYWSQPEIRARHGLLGRFKNLSAEQMRAELLETIKPSAQDWDRLALQRAMQLREGLLARGIAVERMKLDEVRVERDASPDWQAHVVLRLSAE